MHSCLACRIDGINVNAFKLEQVANNVTMSCRTCNNEWSPADLQHKFTENHCWLFQPFITIHLWQNTSLLKTNVVTHHLSKVTIRSDLFETVPNFDGLSRENYEVFRDAELSRIPNPVPILYHFECNITSQVAVDHFDGLIPIPNSLSSDAFIRAQNAPNPFSANTPPQTSLGELTTLPRPPNRLGRGYLIPLHLDAFGALNSIPNFYRRFMGTLHWRLNVYTGNKQQKRDTDTSSVVRQN